jgi:hypothetical protein
MSCIHQKNTQGFRYVFAADAAVMNVLVPDRIAATKSNNLSHNYGN